MRLWLPLILKSKNCAWNLRLDSVVGNKMYYQQAALQSRSNWLVDHMHIVFCTIVMDVHVEYGAWVFHRYLFIAWCQPPYKVILLPMRIVRQSHYADPMYPNSCLVTNLLQLPEFPLFSSFTNDLNSVHTNTLSFTISIYHKHDQSSDVLEFDKPQWNGSCTRRVPIAG